METFLFLLFHSFSVPSLLVERLDVPPHHVRLQVRAFLASYRARIRFVRASPSSQTGRIRIHLFPSSPWLCNLTSLRLIYALCRNEEKKTHMPYTRVQFIIVRTYRCHSPARRYELKSVRLFMCGYSGALFFRCRRMQHRFIASSK